MSDKDLTHTPSSRSEPNPSAQERRKARLDEALRANLRRRKEQVRTRGLDGESGGRDTPSIFKTGDSRTGSK